MELKSWFSDYVPLENSIARFVFGAVGGYLVVRFLVNGPALGRWNDVCQVGVWEANYGIVRKNIQYHRFESFTAQHQVLESTTLMN